MSNAGVERVIAERHGQHFGSFWAVAEAGTHLARDLLDLRSFSTNNYQRIKTAERFPTFPRCRT
jgi:hypothetical protein